MTPLLSIVTITYNHEPFIAKTIEGVLMQQVKFPIELIIAEDCSTDGTRAICQRYAEEYPDLIRLITSDSNVGAIANERRAMLAARGKYIAFCEGDDYWTDPLKLQKQVDFLESHPDYSVTFHRCKHYNVETKLWRDDECEFLFTNVVDGVDISMDLFIDYWITQPLTMVLRSESLELKWYDTYKYYRDFHQIYHLLKAGKGYLFYFIGGVRIIQSGGIHSTLSTLEYCKISLPMSREFFKYNKTPETRRDYLRTIQPAIVEFYKSGQTIKSIYYCFLHLRVSHSLKQFIKNIIKLLTNKMKNYGND